MKTKREFLATLIEAAGVNPDKILGEDEASSASDDAPEEIEEGKESRYEGPKLDKISGPHAVTIKIGSGGGWTLSHVSDKTFIPAHGREATPEAAFKKALKAAREMAGWK